MLVGVVADSHDNLPAIAAAVGALLGAGAEHLLHAGDVIAPFAARAWREFPGPITAVYGNNDGERAGLAKVLTDIHDPPHAFALGGRRIVLAHDAEMLTEAVLEGADLAVFGHSHKVGLERRGRTLVLNPGEVGGWLTGTRTCALVDLSTLEVEMLEL